MENLKFDRIFITGDQHGCIDNILYLNLKEHISENDLVISLGDFGVPYWSASKKTKGDLSTFELFNTIHTNYAIIQGNHSKRFERVKWLEKKNFVKEILFTIQNIVIFIFYKMVKFIILMI